MKCITSFQSGWPVNFKWKFWYLWIFPKKYLFSFLEESLAWKNQYDFVWPLMLFFFIFIHRKYTRSTHNNPLTRKTSSSCMVYAPLETQYITDKYFWKDVPCDVKAPFICKHNSDLLGFHKLRLSLFDYLVASNHTEKKSILK